MVSYCRIIVLAILCGGYCSAADTAAVYLTDPSHNELNEIARLSRESLLAIINRRPVKQSTPVSLRITNAQNSAILQIIKSGQILTTGSATGSNLASNIRLAASNAVYNKNFTSLDDSVLFIQVCAKGKKISMPVFHKMSCGTEAYYLEYGQKKIFMSALEPVLHGWNWKETILELAKRVAPKSITTTSELIRVAADKDFKLTVFPVLVLASVGAQDAPLQLRAFTPEKTLVSEQSLRGALLDVAEWYKKNQMREGAYPQLVNLIDGKLGEKAEAFTSSLNIIALARLAERLEDKGLEFQARRELDYLLINDFYENPENDQGYVKEKSGISLVDSAAALWAISVLAADSDNREIAAIAQRLCNFILAMRQQSGEFIGWYQPAGRRERRGEYAPVALIALVDWKAHNHSAEILKSAEYYRGFYTIAAGAHPPVEVIGWYTAAASLVYGHTQRRAFAQWILEINSVLARRWLEDGSLTKDSECTAYDAALVLKSLCEALSLQKLLVSSGSKADSVRTELFRNAIRSAASSLLHLQVRSGAEVYLMQKPEMGVGAFRECLTGMTTTLTDNAMAVMALNTALSVLDNTDY